MTLTTMPEDTEGLVCVVSVDTPYGCGGEVQRTYHRYRTPSLARLFAGRFVQQMEDEGYDTKIRGVFVQDEDGQNWRTIGSYFNARGTTEY